MSCEYRTSIQNYTTRDSRFPAGAVVCGGPIKDTEAEAIAAWNERPGDAVTPVKIHIGTSCLSRDLVWCECGRGVSRNGFWNFCPHCGRAIDQESYRAACDLAKQNLATKFIGADETLELMRPVIEQAQKVARQVAPLMRNRWHCDEKQQSADGGI